MARKRPPEYDYICLRCGCPCEADGSRHWGGGTINHRACGWPPRPILRSVFEAEMQAIAECFKDGSYRLN